MAVEDGEVAANDSMAVDRPGSPDSGDADRKRLRDSKDDDGASSKRHKDHKHKEHKKHKKHKKDKDRGSSKEAGSRSGSVSPQKVERNSGGDRRSRANDRSRSRERHRRSRDRGDRDRDTRERSRGRDNRERSRDRGRGHDDRGGRDNNNRDRSRGRAEREREARTEAYKRELGSDDRRSDRAPAREPIRERARESVREKPAPAPAPAPDPEAEAAKAEEEEAYRKRVEEQMKESGAMDDDDSESEDEEAAAIEAARKRRQAIKDKHAAAAALKPEPVQESGSDKECGDEMLGRGQGEDTSDDEEDEDNVKGGDVDEMVMVDDRKKPEYDMFNEQIDVENAAGATGEAIERGGNALDVENFDDADGYYKFQMGEVMNGRYNVYEVTGKGVFSNVLRAKDSEELSGGRHRDNNGDVAIKVIRNNEMMKKCGDKELHILQLLAENNGADKHNIVQLNEHFLQHGHLCLVFEALAMNLREVIKKFGNKRGINIGAVHKFAKQMFVGLKHLKNCKVVHADIKPDNILVNDKHNQIKICDFGSASFIQECEITPYLVSRWYRAPEITLCLRYDYGIDMWSIATCLYELYTGKVMFPGNTNNDMLRRFQEIKGKFPNKLLKRSITKQVEIGRPVDFTDDFKFMRVLHDKVTKKESIKLVAISEKPERDLLKLLMPKKLKNEDEEKMVRSLCDLLHTTLMLNADQRLTPEQALQHPFVKTKIQ